VHQQRNHQLRNSINLLQSIALSLQTSQIILGTHSDPNKMRMTATEAREIKIQTERTFQVLKGIVEIKREYFKEEQSAAEYEETETEVEYTEFTSTQRQFSGPPSISDLPTGGLPALRPYLYGQQNENQENKRRRLDEVGLYAATTGQYDGVPSDDRPGTSAAAYGSSYASALASYEPTSYAPDYGLAPPLSYAPHAPDMTQVTPAFQPVQQQTDNSVTNYYTNYMQLLGESYCPDND
jgi:hypothetical protein